MNEYTIIEENEVKQLLSIPLAKSVIEQCFREKAEGNFVAHPKINIKGAYGDLRITPGESLQDMNVIGFRLYDVIRDDFSKQPQPIIVYNNESGRLKGIVISHTLGAYRTAAINTAMQAHFNGGEIEELGVVGTGFQARIHTEMYARSFKPRTIRVFGRTDTNVDAFITEMSEKLGTETQLIKCRLIEELADIEVLLLATRSTTGLLNENVFTGKKIITTIGPKIRNKSEVSNNFARSCDLLVTDSIEQVKAYGDRFFVEDLSLVHDFSALIKNTDHTSAQRVLLCSVGMGGTEVALANALLNKKLAATA